MKSFISSYLICLVLAFPLAGCGGGGGGEGGSGGNTSGGAFLISGDDEHWFSTNGSTWTEIFGTPVGGVSKSRSAKGNGVIITASWGDGIYYTDYLEKIDWTHRVIASGYNARDIAFGGGKFVLVGESSTPQIYHASNPDSWTLASAPGAIGLSTVAYGNGVFAAGGLSDIWYSSDGGATWTAAGLSVGIVDIYFANGLFMAIGDQGSFPNNVSVSYTSTDGINWSGPVTIDLDDMATAVAYGNGVWVAVGWYQTFQAKSWVSSDNGASWTPYPLGGLRLEHIAFGAGKFVAVGDLAFIISSSNGVSWTNVSLPSGGANLYGIEYLP